MNDYFFQEVLNRHRNAEKLIEYEHVGGGCINSTIKIRSESNQYFIKYNTEEYENMFLTEASGLQLLANHSSLKIPTAIGSGIYVGNSYLLLEWLEHGTMDDIFWRNFGTSLAKLHRESNYYFGLDHDNYIGRLSQSNRSHVSWSEFFVNERIEPQLQLALKNGYISGDLIAKFERLYPQLENLIPIEPPALLHGDLWSGNFSSSKPNIPCVFDPAVHYGHRETELAFTHLFGGFSPAFYSYYDEEYALESGFQDRIDIHNLYPLLVHVNLFGPSYLSGILKTLRRFT